MPPQDKDVTPAKHEPDTRRTAALQHARILLVSTNGETGEAARARLMLAGGEVLRATQVDFLTEVQAQRPDLVLVVGPLPDADGADACFAVARALKATDGSYLPVIVAAEMGEDEAAGETDADDFLPVPISPALLLRRVGALLHLKRLYQAQVDSAQEIEETCLAAQKEAARLQAVFEHSLTAMLLVSTDEGRILSANTQARQLMGGASEDLLGQPLMRLAPADDTDNWAAAIAARPEEDFVREEGSLVTAQGECVPVRVESILARVSADAAHQAEPTRLVTLTDLRPAQARVAKERQAAATEIANAFSREINSPLFVISSNAEMLQSALLDQDSSLRAKLGRIGDAARRISLATGRLTLPPSHSE